MSPSQVTIQCLSEKETSNQDTRKIRNVIVSFLSRCGLLWPAVEFDHDFDSACREEAIRRGCPMDGPNSLAPFIAGGVGMATTAYAHLPNKSTQIFTALYTAFLIYLDDIFQYDVDAVREFNERFTLQKPQSDPTLDCFASLLFDLPEHFNRIVSNFIVTSTLNLVTALLVEHETQGMTLRTGALGYPTFSRVLSGASEAYGLFAFPFGLSIPTFIQALPEMMIYINNVNDILSFYKEEMSGETVNRVSLLAALHKTSKHEALWRLADDAVAAHGRVLQILKPHKPAFDAFKAFASGYLGFHAVLPRYKLTDLDLHDDNA